MLRIQRQSSSPRISSQSSVLSPQHLLLLLPFCLWLTLNAGCQEAPPPKVVVGNTIEARQTADAYLASHNLDWGPSRLVFGQRGSFYVEYGDANNHHGLTVYYDGHVEEP